MTRKVNCIMLIDDNESDNYYHEFVIKKNDCADQVIVCESGEKALEYLQNAAQKGNPNPDIIFLDINMPGMSGWQFLTEYNKLDKEMQGKVIVVMLTAFERADDKQKATESGSLIKYKTKPLTVEMLNEVYDKYFVATDTQG
ncbi:MAG: hypothetical protein JWO03_3833 [Bacteroidetes bacterium]|nr:hypothetical protein [Bacteroidota bacterium]